jgi:hypothetical protein
MMSTKFYHKYRDALEAEGYRVDEHGYVWDAAGNQSAGEDNYGNVQSKDPNVTEICRAVEAAAEAKPPKKAKRAKKVDAKPADTEMVRARNADGHFIADDPSTPDVNEAWVAKTVKKVTGK